MHTTLEVPLGTRAYKIHIGPGTAVPTKNLDSGRLLSIAVGSNRVSPSTGGTDLAIRNSSFVISNSRSVVVTSPAFAAAQPAYLATLRAAGIPIHITAHDGERAKRTDQLEALWEALAAAGANRHTTLIALGGGVIGDLAGFAAATYQRGIPLIQIPTTLLAMVDSSVGGKTGINLTAGKNLAGAFWQPIAVFADTNFLATLPPREFAAGTAEIIKYALLVPDKTLWHTLTQNTPLTGTPLNWQHPALPEIIRTCCAIKAAIVADDERETAPSNGRALLNLGHTFAHAIENTAGYGQYLHGEAVAIGILCAARLSAALGFLDPSEIPAIENLLLQNNLPTTLRSPLSTDTLLAAMQHDKKARAGSINFVLLKSSEQRTPNEGQRAESEQRAIAAAGAFTHTLTLASPATTALLRQIWQTVQPTAHRSTFSSPAPDFSNS